VSVRAAVVVGCACVVAFGGPIARAASEPGGSAPPPLVEAPSCAAPTGEVPVIDLREGQTLVSFDVPAITRLQLAAGGSVAAVATNTGCAPRSGDVFVVVPSEGVDGRAASAEERAAALSLAGAGDWREPATWHTVV